VSSPEIVGSRGPDGDAAGAFSLDHRGYRPRWWLHILLFALTLCSSTFMGALFFGWVPVELAYRLGIWRLMIHPTFIAEGLKFSLPLLTILLAHEMGHYVAARRHGLLCTPPYFIPMPLWIIKYSPGTLGAVMRIKEPITTRQQLLDIGAAGPIAGFLVTIPVLLVGLAASEPIVFPENAQLDYFAEPLLFEFFARTVFFPDLASGEDIFLHPMAWAAWWGLLVTALNLLPFFQLDGGHISYALFGAGHRRWARWLLAAFVILIVFWPGWALWAAILFLVGPEHPPIPHEREPLDRLRVVVGWLSILIFILCFTVAPIQLALAG
jgi:membrane-associated protease RseP (regulator of RpoE activity)